MIAPWALLTVTNGVLWAWILNPTYGIANTLLVRLGLLAAPKPWLSDTFWTMNVIILADAWKTVPEYDPAAAGRHAAYRRRSV